MSAYGIVCQNGCYGVKKGSVFMALSNCTFRLVSPVLAGSMSGYLGRAIHKDGHEKEFFYAKSVAKTKVERFIGVLNSTENDHFFRTYSVQLSNTQLEALLAELETSVPITDDIPKAVYIVGKNRHSQRNTVIWALNKDVFINAKGNLVNPEDYGFKWISHLVKDGGKELAHESRKASIQLPLTTTYFDIMCHFLNGSLKQATSNDPHLFNTVEEVFRGTGLDISKLKDQESGNFLSTFFTLSMSVIISHYDVWQTLAGSCPLPAAVGDPDCGKSTACKVGIACTGGWKHNFFASVSEKVSGKVGSVTTLGYVVDDPTKPQDVGEAAKKFFNEGSNINCNEEWTPRCCPIFAINHHVVEWLSKPERDRLMSRIIFIPFESVKRSISDEEASIWQQMFDCLINKVSSVVGKVIALGEWVLTQEGRDFYNECVGIVLKGFGEEGRGTRFSKMWACGLLAARKMQELTSSITDDQVIGFFMNKVSPHVLHYQKSAVFVQSSASDFMTSHDVVEGREAFVNRLGDKMEIVVQGMDTNTVGQFLTTNCSTSKLSADGSVQRALAIRAEQFQDRCMESDTSPIKPEELRSGVQAYGIGIKRAEQRFVSPSSKVPSKRKLKSCVMVKRSLFKQSTLDVLDEATGATVNSAADAHVKPTTKETMAENSERDDDLLRENKKLKEEMKAIRTEFNNEMERLEQENSLLKERLKGEESQKGILEKEIRERENEVIGVRNELTKLKEQGSSKRSLDIVQAGCEMLQVTVEPQEVCSRKNNRSRTSQAKDLETCPICKKRAGGVDWQQCTQVDCGQWVHCRCEAEQNKTYKCPGCRNC